MLRVVALLLSLLSVLSGPALSETYYVAPLGTVISGTPNGTEKLPFVSIGAALKSGKVKGGDTLLLKDGAYGSVTIKTNAAFDVPLTIKSQNGKSAQFDNILLAGNTRNLILSNLSVWPRDPTTGLNYLVRAYDTTSDITVDGLDIRSEKGAKEYMKWDMAKWNARKFSGIFLQGARGKVMNSKLIGVYHGIMVMSDSLIIDNVISGFNGDGMRAASNSLVQHNRVYDCVKTDDNHDDGFQSMGGVSNLVLDSNTIIEWTGSPGHPLRCPLQGIGFFGGNYKDLTIMNNLVVVSAYHGISVYGVSGAQIMNNTVVHNDGHTLAHPYVFISPSKDGIPSTDVMVANNVAMSIRGKASETDRVIFINNSVIGTPSIVFENPAAFDYRPKASSGFIDSGDAMVAPATDVIGQKRPNGPLPDRGAYEVQTDGALAPTPVDPVVAPSPAVPKRIKISIGDLGKEPQPPILKRPPLKAGNAKRIILE